MNYTKKIEKLRKRIEELEKENAQLREGYEQCEKTKDKYILYTKLANDKMQEYNDLIIELNEDRKRYKEMMNTLKSSIGKTKQTYKKKFNNIKENIK